MYTLEVNVFNDLKCPIEWLSVVAQHANGGVTCPHHHQVGSVSLGIQTDILSKMEQALESGHQAYWSLYTATQEHMDYIEEQIASKHV